MTFAPLIIPGRPPEPVQAPTAVTPLPERPKRPGQPPGGVERNGAPERLRAALKVLRWSYGDLAAELKRSPETVRSWGNGKGNCPVDMLVWLEDLARCHVERPAPGSER
jgi:hypothetical protein